MKSVIVFTCLFFLCLHAVPLITPNGTIQAFNRFAELYESTFNQPLHDLDSAEASQE